jgi:tetratricopeptide (TPR) repeat protein
MARPAARVKINRKALREPDEFQTLTQQAGVWAQGHRNLLMGVGAAVLGIAAVALGIGWYRSHQAAAAGAQFQAAVEDFEGARFAPAIEEFTAVGRDYPGTSFGRLSTLYRGHALARQGDAAGAATAYTEYLASSPTTEYLRQEALTGLGAAKEAAGDKAGALDAYGQAASIDGPFRIQAQLATAQLHELAGEPDKAREVYLAILKESPGGYVRSILETKIPADVATSK